MNVLLVSCMDRTALSGVVTYYQALAAALRDHGHGVKIVTFGMAPRWLRKLISGVWRLGASLHNGWGLCLIQAGYAVGLSAACRRAARVGGWDVVHAQDPLSACVARRVFRSTPIIMTAHFNDHPVAEVMEAKRLGQSGRRMLERW